MTCQWREKIGPYVDGELEPSALQGLADHLPGCADCSAAVVEQQEIKKAVRIAGKRFSAPPDLYASVRKQINPSANRLPWWRFAAVAAALLVAAALSFAWYTQSRAENAALDQLVDQHVTMLASLHPMDVISEDRHTVKPWFQGRIPFTFNLPEPNNSDFKLLGGNLVYARHAPGAELIYQVRQHKISVFIFQERDGQGMSSAGKSTFTVKGWRQNGLQYYVVTDAARDDADRLRDLLEQANRI
ncbi:MAG TPA: zf-HC2 domain-containing protein [Candidatus Angelobacter sp.]|jgi:anti-sigma factor RsiW|nr:zf-HC2 domain-containing protein [Candidatus Angelobacter sp.]